jgi:bacterioferritin
MGYHGRKAIPIYGIGTAFLDRDHRSDLAAEMKGEIMPNEKNSPGEVQQAIRLGAITGEYKADTQKVIQALNGLRSTEIMSYLQYMQHQYMAVSLLSPGLKSEFEAHAAQELDHANRLAERVQQLGGVPIYDPKEISSKAANVGVVPEQGATLTEMVVEDLLLERQQIEVYSALIREIGDRDLVTRHVLVGILAETEKHASELADYLKRTADTPRHI